MKGRIDNRTSLKWKLSFSKRHYQENEKSDHGLGENICEKYTWWKTIVKNTQRILETQK